MLTNDLEAYYTFKDEPVRGCLLALRSIVRDFHPDIDEKFKWKIPFFTLNGKSLCYFNYSKTKDELYIGFYCNNRFDHPILESKNRSIVKSLSIDPETDLPLNTIHEVLELAVDSVLSQ